VPVRVDVVQRKLASIREAVEQLRAQGGVTTERLGRDIMLRWAVERGLQVAAEAVFDTGNHILAGEFSDPADEYARIAERMSAHDVISRETATRLQGLSGFRNILVHEYAQVDLGRLVEALARLDDLNAFVADVEGWLTRRESPH
jgi:uncharacterized protein YutE (UPF0331/DUF86 family)